MRNLALGILILIGGALGLLYLGSSQEFDSYKESVGGMAKIRLAYTYVLDGPQSHYLKYKNNPQLSGKLPYLIFPHRTSQRWALYVPGIFSYLDSPFVKYFSSELHKRNFNVLLVPNTFTSDFLKGQPKFRPGQIRKEAQLFCDLVNRVKQERLIEQPMELVGVSYGGLLGSAISGTCPQYFKSLTLVSPPLNLELSMKRIFNQLEETRNRVKNILGANESLMFAKATLWNPYYFKALFSRFFFDGLYFTQFSLFRLNGRGKSTVNNIQYGGKRYRNWQHESDLHAFYLEPTRVWHEQDPHQFDLRFWLTQSRLPFYLFASLNDPINDKKQWELWEKKGLTYGHLNLKNKGGHLGFIGGQEFSQFLDQRFNEAL